MIDREGVDQRLYEWPRILVWRGSRENLTRPESLTKARLVAPNSSSARKPGWLTTPAYPNNYWHMTGYVLVNQEGDPFFKSDKVVKTEQVGDATALMNEFNRLATRKAFQQ